MLNNRICSLQDLNELAESTTKLTGADLITISEFADLMVEHDIEGLNWLQKICPYCWHPLYKGWDEEMGHYYFCGNKHCDNDNYYRVTQQEFEEEQREVEDFQDAAEYFNKTNYSGYDSKIIKARPPMIEPKVVTISMDGLA